MQRSTFAAKNVLPLYLEQLQVINGECEEDVTSNVEEIMTLAFRIVISDKSIRIIDNFEEACNSCEIIFLQVHGIMIEFSQSNDGYNKVDLQLLFFQVNNHLYRCVHPG